MSFFSPLPHPPLGIRYEIKCSNIQQSSEVENYSFRFEIEWIRIDKDVVQIVYFKTDITKHKIK